MWPNPGFLRPFGYPLAAGFTKNYALACFDPAGNSQEITQKSGRADDPVHRPYRRARQPACTACCRYGSASASTRCWSLAGNRLLIDPDTLWQVTVGQWMLDHHAVPHTDVYSFTMRGQPWISTQWLAQVLYAKAYALFGWSGPVVLAAAASAPTFALLAKFLSRHLSESATHGVRRRGAGADRAASAGAAACAGVAGDGGLGRRIDRRPPIGATRRRSGCCR